MGERVWRDEYPYHDDGDRRRRRDTTVKELVERRNRLLKDTLGYTDSDNPFGVEGLAEPFVWGKKLERSGFTTVQASELLDQTDRKLVEIKAARERRAARDREIKGRQVAREAQEREREAEGFHEYEKSEAQFLRRLAISKHQKVIENCKLESVHFIGPYVYGSAPMNYVNQEVVTQAFPLSH